MLLNIADTKFVKCSSVVIPQSYFDRVTTGNESVDSIFGSNHLKGLVAGSTITITGTPGAGKSTFLLQVGQMLADRGKKFAVASGEECVDQLAYTCNRLQLTDVDIAHLKNVEDIASAMSSYDVMVVDSFQALRSNNKNLKKREFYQYAQDLLISTAKNTGCILVFVLHITTTGLPKGGTDIIHAVEVNMKVSVDKDDDSMRIIDVYKNRFGETKKHMALMTSKGFDFQDIKIYDPVETKAQNNVSETRKNEILSVESDKLTLADVCSKLGVSGQTAAILLREMVGENKLEKIGRGVNAIWKISKECKVLRNMLS